MPAAKREHKSAAYKLYQEQLEESPLSTETREAITRVNEKKRIHVHMNMLDDLIGVTAVLAVIVAGVITQVTYLNFAGDTFRQTGKLPDGFKDAAVVTVFKFISSFLAFTQFVFTLTRGHLLHRLNIVRYVEPARSTPCPLLCCFTCTSGDPWCAMLRDGGFRNMMRGRHCYFTSLGLVTFIECFLLILHVPPFVDFSFTMNLPLWDPMPTTSANIEYDMHVNIFSMIAVVQLYTLLRLLRNHVGLRDPSAIYVGKVNGVKADSVEFALKLSLKKYPWTFLIVGASMNVCTTAVLVWFVEKYSPRGMDTFEQALWCTIVTMCTVGYGDVFPVSVPGRIIMTLGGIIGGSMVAGFMTTIFVDLAILTENERRVLHVIDEQKRYSVVRHTAAAVIQGAWGLREASITLEDIKERRAVAMSTLSAAERMRRKKAKKKESGLLRKIRDRALKASAHDQIHAKRRLFRLIARARAHRLRPPQHDFRLANIEARVSTLVGSHGVASTEQYVGVDGLFCFILLYDYILHNYNTIIS